MRWMATWAAVVFALVVPGESWGQTAVGTEFAVNADTNGNPRTIAASMDSTGGFVVVWDWNGADGDSYGVVGRRFGADATALGSDFSVNSYTSGYQGRAAVASADDGAFVVAWRSDPYPFFTSNTAVQRFGSSGAAQGGEFIANTYTTGDQAFTSIAVSPNGDFVVVWESYGQTTTGSDIFGQRYSSAGVALDSEFPVNTSTAASQFEPSVASDANGDFVVVWATNLTGNFDVIGQRFSSGGVVLGSEFLVNSYTTGAQGGAAVASAPDGSFVVVWTGADQDGYGVFGQRYDSAGVSVGGEFQVNTFTTDNQERPAVAGDQKGNFLVVWSSTAAQDGSAWGIFGRWYGSSGAAVGGEFQVNSYTTGYQASPAVAANAAGDFVVVWNGEAAHDSYGSVGQRYSTGVFTDGFESGDTSAWSATVP